MKRLATRQVHLDFHTSPLMPGVGSNFSKENFQEALKIGHLSSITLFAKGHHSMCYYPTKVGTMHPSLKFDLLGAEIEAAHEIGVRAPIYITAGWSAYDAEHHPEWWVRNKDGSVATENFDINAKPEDPKPECSWIHLCLNDGSYCQHIYDLTQEICDRYPVVDGLFYDICFLTPACYCDECKAGMKAMGLDWQKDEDAQQYLILKRQSFMTKCANILHQKHPEGTIFFNSGGADQYRPMYHDYQTHFEMEDLPTVWGGYDKMPTRARFFSRTGKDYLGMTGKFHMAWGEFGGFKWGEALKFETASMLTYGARCSIGDQLHPDGRFDLETYRNIGYAYEYVEKMEPYCFDSTPATRLGIYLSANEKADEGLTKILLESQNNFDIVYKDDFEPFDTVIFPDCVVLSDESLEKLNAFIARGGKVLFTGDSLIKDGKFQIDCGAEYQGDYGYDKDFIVVGDQVAKNMVTSPMLAYGNARKVQVTDAEVLATVMLPYFSRTYGQYCSHKNTPYNREDGGHPGMIRKGNIIYCAHRICEMYLDYGSLYHRNYLVNALDLLNTDKMLEVSMPSAGRAELNLQPGEDRYVLNMLYGSPIQRGYVSVIEDLPTLYNIEVKIHVPETIKKVTMPIEGKELEFTQEAGTVTITVPSLQCHAMVVFEF